MNLSTMNKQIIFVDSSVQDYQSLIQGIDPAQIVILNENFSAIDQITNALADQKDIEAVHIVSHGSEGSLKLGADVLNDNNLETFSDRLKQWGSALTANGDILLYGCDVAAGEVGANFVKRLSEITGADVAASTNKTGNAALGGDWELEKTTGAIEADLAFSDEALATYQSVLTPKNTAINLTGTGSVSIANSSTFNLTSAITVEASFKSNGFSKAWESIIGKGDSSWRIARGGQTGTGNSLEFAIGTDAGTQVVVGTTNVNDGQWHHVAAVYNGSTMSLYIDGVLEGTLNYAGGIPTNAFDVLIGANAQVTGRNFNGQIDEVRVWNTARTQAQIQGSMNQNIDPNTAGLLGYWKFDEGAGVTASDISGTDNSGTLQSGATWVTDTIPPTVALTSAAAATVTAAFPVTATFSESTTNFLDSDITVTNGTVSGFSGTGTTYNFTVTPTGSGTVTVNIPANIATDAAGNNNTAATALTRTADTTAPTATFTPADNATSVAVTADLVVTLSEAVQKGTGNIVIKKTDGTVVETIDVTSPNVTVSGSNVTINPLADLAPGT
ncbi:DUF4347 domain-containing protein, partial [Microcoleus sp. B9-D4]|uniref:DUF4347 domain-containing protein n=1 Tax=Microcoleus sp. B9-D4 TaxID=2818711 RepID=UPI002FD69366